MIIDFRIIIPRHLFHHEEMAKVRVFASHGEFCLLPRHIDCVADIKPGMVSCLTADGEKRLFAVDGGILVKRGREVMLSTPRAVRGDDEASLREEVSGFFTRLAEREKRTRSALRRIEADFVRTLVEVEEDVHAG